MPEQRSKTTMILTGGGIKGTAYESGQAITARNQVIQGDDHLTLAKFMSNYEKLVGKVNGA